MRTMKLSIALIIALSAALILSCEKDEGPARDPSGDSLNALAAVGDPEVLQPDFTLAEAQASGAVSVTAGNSTFFIGYQQVSSTNQDPILMKYTDGVLAWVRTDYETTGDDGKGYGLLWDGVATMYAVFSVTGTQGTPEEDFRRWAGEGWHESYGQGGGPKAAVLVKINTLTGEPERATYLMARLSNGNANSLVINTMGLLNSGNVLLTADSWFSPLKTNKQPFTCQGDSPFDYTLELSADLSYAVSATALGCE